MLKGAIIHLHSLFDKSHFSNICTDKGMGRNYWLPKYMKKVRSSQPAISVLNWVKYRFPRLLIKRQTSVENECKTNATDVQRTTMSGTTNGNNWQWQVQRVAASGTASDNKWQRVTTSNKKWQWVTLNDSEW